MSASFIPARHLFANTCQIPWRPARSGRVARTWNRMVMWGETLRTLRLIIRPVSSCGHFLSVRHAYCFKCSISGSLFFTLPVSTAVGSVCSAWCFSLHPVAGDGFRETLDSLVHGGTISTGIGSPTSVYVSFPDEIIIFGSFLSGIWLLGFG